MIILQCLELENKPKYSRYWILKLKSTVQIRFYLKGCSEDGYYRSITIKHFDEFTRGNKYIKLIVDSIIKLN